MIRHIVRIALCAALVAALPAAAEELRTTTLYRTGVNTKNIGYDNFAVRDVAGDSRPEIVSCVSGLVVAYGYNGTTYGTNWFSPYVGCSAVAVADRDGDGHNEVFAGTAVSSYSQTGPGYLYAFDASCFGPELAKVQVSAVDGVTDVAVGNTDADPGLEVVALTAKNVYIYDAVTFALKWSAPYGGNHVAIADVDNDGKNDIVITGTDGHVLNGYTQTYKWGYVGGFGNVMAIGDVDNDGKLDIVGVTGSNTKIIHGDTMTTVTLSVGGQSVAIGDANNDGLNEIVIGDGYNSVAGYNAAGTKLWNLSNPLYGAQGVAVGDPDGDGKNQVIWGGGANSSGADSLLIADVGTQTVQYRATDIDGTFTAAAGDLNGDGKPEIVLATYSTESGYSGGAAYILDGATRRLLGTLALPSYVKIFKVLVGQTDHDAAREIVLVGTPSYDTYIYVYDGVTFANEFTSPAPQCCSSPQIVTNSVLVRDVDGDGVDEIIYATTDYKFHILNGASAFIKYTSPVLDSSIQDMSLADIDGDGVLDLVVGTSAGVYVFKTSDWSQRTHISVDASYYTARRVAAGSGHFAFTAANSALTMYSGSTLTQEWSCTPVTAMTMAFVTLAGTQRLAMANTDSTLRLYPVGGAACPAYDTISRPLGSPNSSSMSFADLDGDGRPELLFGTYYDFSVTALGWNSEARGDVDVDGIITDADMDALAAYFYGGRSGVPPSADVNADGTIRPDDLFYLINYRRGTGSAPPQ